VLPLLLELLLELELEFAAGDTAGAGDSAVDTDQLHESQLIANSAKRELQLGHRTAMGVLRWDAVN